MALSHLTDDQVQEYLDGNLAKQNSSIRSHLQNCTFCQEQLKQYGHLYSAFKKEETLQLSTNFAANILNSIEQESRPGFTMQFAQGIILAFGLLIGLGTTIYFTGLSKMAKFFTDFNESGKAFSGLLTHLSAYLAEINLNVGLLGVAAFALAFLAFFDHFVLRSGDRAVSFFK